MSESGSDKAPGPERNGGFAEAITGNAAARSRSFAEAVTGDASGRALVFHIDDVGMCHGANTAFLDLMRAGNVTCGSIMVPCPWFREIAAEAVQDKTLDRTLPGQLDHNARYRILLWMHRGANVQHLPHARHRVPQ